MKEIVLEREKLVGAIKVIDGLFMGDILASQDLEFMTMNDVNNVVNTSIELPNTFESYGVEYHNLNWAQNFQSPLFKSYSDLEFSFKFVQKCLESKKCVLVVSTYGKNRCGSFLALYLMMRFRWSFGMTVQFIQSRRYDVKLKKVFVEGIKDLQKDMVTYGKGSLTYQWGVPSNKQDQDEVIVMHTYLNTLLRQNSSNLGVIVERKEVENDSEGEEEKKEVKWQDSVGTEDKIATVMPEFNIENVKEEVKKLKESDKTNTFYISADTSGIREGSILKVKTNTSVTERQGNSQVSSIMGERSLIKEEDRGLQMPSERHVEAMATKKSRSYSPNKRTNLDNVRASSLMPLSLNSVFKTSKVKGFKLRSAQKKRSIFEEEKPQMIQFFMSSKPKLMEFHRESFEVRNVKNSSKYHIRRKIKRLEKRRIIREKKRWGLDFGDCGRIYRNTVVTIER